MPTLRRRLSGLRVSGDTADEISEHHQSKIITFQKWCNDNCLCVNATKTECIIFNNSKKDIGDLKLHVDDQTIQNTDCFKYLGISLDSKLSFKAHCVNMLQKMSQRAYLIRRNRNIFTQYYTKIFCESLILSVANYCISIWGLNNSCFMEKCDRIIRSVIKNIIIPASNVNKKCKRQNWQDLFELCNWFTTSERMTYSVLCFVKKHAYDPNSSLYQLFKPSFTYVDERLEKSFRKPHNFTVPTCRTSVGQSTLKNTAIGLWNTLSPELQNPDLHYERFSNMVSNTIIVQRLDPFTV